MRIVKGDLSAPVLAIIVTIGIIAAGLILLAWFWWFAPTAGKTGTLVVVGTPTLINATSTIETCYNSTLYISLKNAGNADVRVVNITVYGKFVPYAGSTPQTSTYAVALNGQTQPVVIKAGNSTVLTATLKGAIIGDVKTVEGVILTDLGTYRFAADVVSR